MKTIPSFDIDHTKLKRGMYISRIDDDVVTYDVRMREPNNGDYLSNEGMHTIEHLYATYVRNTEYDDNIIYVGPMGCRTGFYFLTRNLPHKDALKLT
ncbi:MAG: S-ribosylhomocysteine lyase, partial [Oscillospiraceae bacterium]